MPPVYYLKYRNIYYLYAVFAKIIYRSNCLAKEKVIESNVKCIVQNAK